MAANPAARCQLSRNPVLSGKGQLPAGEAADTLGSSFLEWLLQARQPEPQVPHLPGPPAGSSPSPDKIGGRCSSQPPSHRIPTLPRPTRTRPGHPKPRQPAAPSQSWWPASANAAPSASHTAPCPLTPAHASGLAKCHLLQRPPATASPLFHASQAPARPEAVMTHRGASPPSPPATFPRRVRLSR